MMGAKIGEALAAFQAEMPTVSKGNTAQVPTKNGGAYSYTYADLADVTAAAMPLLTAHGLSFSAAPRATPGGGYELRGILLHTSGESIKGALPLNGRTSQEIGSAITYARRYLLGCLTGIVTDDDDDAQAAQAAPPMSARPTAPRQAERPAQTNLDAETALNDAMAAATTVEDMRRIYREHQVGNAPADVAARFRARADEIEAGGGDG